MEHATQRLYQCPQFRRDSRRQLEAVESRDGNVFRQRSGQACDPMLTIELALVRIAGSAIRAKWITALAVTVSPLIAHHPISHFQILHRPAHLCDFAAKFMTQDLRLNRERNGFPLRIQIVISLAAKEMKISPANAHSSHLDNHFVGGNRWIRCLTDYNFFNIFEKSSFHQEPFYQLSKAIYRSLRLLTLFPSGRSKSNRMLSEYFLLLSKFRLLHLTPPNQRYPTSLRGSAFQRCCSFREFHPRAEFLALRPGRAPARCHPNQPQSEAASPPPG